MSASIAERYEIEELIASGGMADVYRGHDRMLDRRVAIKRLRGSVDHASRERFEREGRLLAGFTHPNAVAVYDAVEDDIGPIIVMEYVEGPTLRAHLGSAGRLSTVEATAIADELLSALGAAHAQGIVHRDVKPGNVLITADGHVKLADFGIATMTDAADLTVAGQVLGTPRYLAPEQLSGRRATPRSDVWAAGTVLSEMVGGTDAPTDVPDWYVAVVDRALAADPAQRYPDADAMRSALRAGARGDVTVVDSTVALPIVVDSTDGSPPTDRRGAVAVGLFVLLGAAIAAGVWALGDHDAPTSVVPEPTSVATLPTTVTPQVTTPAPTAAPPIVVPGGPAVRPEPAAKTEKAEKPDKPEKAEKPAKVGKAGKPAATAPVRDTRTDDRDDDDDDDDDDD